MLNQPGLLCVSWPLQRNTLVEHIEMNMMEPHLEEILQDGIPSIPRSGRMGSTISQKLNKKSKLAALSRTGKSVVAVESENVSLVARIGAMVGSTVASQSGIVLIWTLDYLELYFACKQIKSHWHWTFRLFTYKLGELHWYITFGLLCIYDNWTTVRTLYKLLVILN